MLDLAAQNITRLPKYPLNVLVQVMVACFEVFQTWEDEYEKLQVLLRDIVKRKREENLKMVWRLSPAHRKLQSRLDHMRRFRRQHEQLRAVIVRVLRPQVKYSFFWTRKFLFQSAVASL